MSLLVEKVKDILLDLENERIRHERQASRASMMCMVRVVRSLERLRTHALAVGRKAAADRETMIESSLRRLYRNIIHTQGCFIEQLLSQHEGCIADSPSRRSDASGFQDKPCMSVINAECSTLGSLVALAKNIAERTRAACTKIASEQHASQRPQVCNTQRTVEYENAVGNRTSAGYSDDEGSCAAHEQPKSSDRTQCRIMHAHGRLFQHIDSRIEFLCNALLSHYTNSRAAVQQPRDSEVPGEKQVDSGGSSEKEQKMKHAIEALNRNIQKLEKRSCDAARALLVDVLSQGTIRDDERFLGILGDTVARFENLENSDFLRLSVQFNLARKYVYDILRLKRSCSVLLSCTDTEGISGV